MKILIKKATIIYPTSEYHLQVKDLYIVNGCIEEIGDSITKDADKIVEEENTHVSMGWFDLRANYREPGEEQKETIFSGIEAAKKGGFTHVATLPSTGTPIDTNTSISYVKNKGLNKGIVLHPYGTISEHLEGKDLAEMMDMAEAGAIGFTDDKAYVSSSLLSRAMLYAKTFQQFISVFPNDKELAKGGHIHEGLTSTKMGIKGIPALAEVIQIQRDLKLAEYNQAQIHFSTISSAESVALIREAKKRQINVTCDIAAHQLYFLDENTKEYDANFKVNPPFRSSEDQQALIEGLKDGTIDAICSDHQPQDTESKRLEFEYAAFGIIGQETAFGALNKVLHKHLDLTSIITKLTLNPRKLLKQEIPRLAIGEKADITIFNPTTSWVFTKNDIQSKSKNTPFIGETLLGKAIFTIV